MNYPRFYPILRIFSNPNSDSEISCMTELGQQRKRQTWKIKCQLDVEHSALYVARFQQIGNLQAIQR